MATRAVLLQNNVVDYARVRAIRDDLIQGTPNVWAINYNIESLDDANYALQHAEQANPEYPILCHYLFELGMNEQAWNGMFSLKNLALLSWLSQYPYIDKTKPNTKNWAVRILRFMMGSKPAEAINNHKILHQAVDRLYAMGTGYFNYWSRYTLLEKNNIMTARYSVDGMVRYHPDYITTVIFDHSTIAAARSLLIDHTDPSVIIEQLNQTDDVRTKWKLVKASIIMGITYYWDTYWRSFDLNVLTPAKYVRMLQYTIKFRSLPIIKRLLDGFVDPFNDRGDENKVRAILQLVFNDFHVDVFELIMDHIIERGYFVYDVLRRMVWSPDDLNHTLTYLRKNNRSEDIRLFLGFLLTKGRNVASLRGLVGIDRQDLISSATAAISCAMAKTLIHGGSKPASNLGLVASIIVSLGITIDPKDVADHLILHRNIATNFNQLRTENYIMSFAGFITNYHVDQRADLMAQLYATMRQKWPKPMADMCYTNLKLMV